MEYYSISREVLKSGKAKFSKEWNIANLKFSSK